MEQAQISVNIDNWNMGDYADFIEATKESNFALMFQTVAKVITGWPFEGDPTEADSYRKLSVKAWRECVTAVTDAINNQFQQGN